MKKTRYCVMCTGENTLDYGLREKETVCPHCGGILRYRRTLFGKEIIKAYRPANENDDTVITVMCKVPRGGDKKCKATM